MDDQIRGKNSVSEYNDVVSRRSGVCDDVYTTVNAVDISVGTIAADQYVTAGTTFENVVASEPSKHIIAAAARKPVF